jgi:polysaccharide pyruvyl transferase WcaK-like protein
MTNIHSNRKTIIIAGEWISSNYGDEVICNTFKYLLQSILSDKDYQIVSLPITPNLTGLWKRILNLLLRKLIGKKHSKFFQFLKSQEISKSTRYILQTHNVCHVIIPGGALFQQYFAKCLRALIVECTKYNVPVSFNACGLGTNDQQSEMIFEWIFSQPCINYISTRDNLPCVTQKQIRVVPDVAIMAYQYYNFKIEKLREPCIGINLMKPEWYIQGSKDNISSEVFNERMIEIVSLLSVQYKIKLFSNGSDGDDLYANWLYNQTQHLGVTIEQKPKNGFELTKIISQFSLVLGFRLHSLIIAYSYAIPTFGIAYNDKVNCWGKMTENDNIYSLSTFPIHDVCQLAQVAIENRIKISKKTELENQIMKQIQSYFK